VNKAAGREILRMHGQRTPWCRRAAIGQPNYKGVSKRTVAAHVQSEALLPSGFNLSPETAGAPRFPKLQELQAMSACPESPRFPRPQMPFAHSGSPKFQQPQARCRLKAAFSAPANTAEGQHRQRRPLCALSSRRVSCVSSQASTAASTVCTPESPHLQKQQAPFVRPESLKQSPKLQRLLQAPCARPESPRLQQAQAPVACPQGGQASPGTACCTAQDLARDLSAEFGGACTGSSEKACASSCPVCRCSPNASTEGPDALLQQNATAALRLNNQFLAEQLQRQQNMVQLLLRQLDKEQARCHSLEDALAAKDVGSS